MFVGWEQFAILAALISVFASTLLLMFSKAFQYSQFQQAAKVEIIYAASTVFLVLVIVGLITAGESTLVNIASNMFSSSFGIPISGVLTAPSGEQATLIDITKLYMQPSVKCSQSIINWLYVVSIPSEAIASVYMEIFMSEHASGFGFKVITERINNATQFLQFFIFVYYLIVHMLNFINHYALFFVGVGIVLRAFPPTRGAGAYIIALSLGLYFVYPLVYILGSSMTLPYIKPSFMQNSGTLEYEPGKGFISNTVCNTPDVGNLQFCSFSSAGKIFEIKSWMDLHKGVITTFLDSNLTSFFTHIVVTICFLPLVSMILVLTFVLSTTNLFGGNIPEIGRGLIKFL